MRRYTLLQFELKAELYRCIPTFSNFSRAKNFDSVNYCSITCTEHPLSVISSAVRISVVSYRTACPIDFDIYVKAVNITLLCTFCCVSFIICHRIIPTLISILEPPLHSARPPATLLVCLSPSLAPSQPLVSKTPFPSAPLSSLLLPLPPNG